MKLCSEYLGPSTGLQDRFAGKYNAAHARDYYAKHHSSLARRLSNWREQGMARRALEMAGQPRSVLDLPCGTGRFWELLTEQPGRRVHVADNSRAMIDTGLALRPPELVARLGEVHCCSAFATGLPDAYVECVFCFRLLHHIGRSEDRLLMLREFRRIAARTVIVSLWVDGNYRGYREQRRLRRRELEEGVYEHNRYVIPRDEIEAEFAAAGLRQIGHVDFLRYWDKWRTYVLAVTPSQ